MSFKNNRKPLIAKIKRAIFNIRPIKYFLFGKRYFNDIHYREVQTINELEISKSPSRTEVINFLLSLKQNETTYLEIGVRNPEHNFNKIKSERKYSVDPGVEFKDNPVDFQMTSDVFFENLQNNQILSRDIRFDVIFIDGLHLAAQVDKDIENAMKFVKDDGFIVLHDCNPPTEWHSREHYDYHNTPARYYWNGTTWKAFLKWRSSSLVNSCCIDSDWGIGLLSKKITFGESIEPVNPFYEFHTLDENRKHYLNLIDYNTFKNMMFKIQHK